VVRLGGSQAEDRLFETDYPVNFLIFTSWYKNFLNSIGISFGTGI
jgi:hypothetical protein